MMCDMLDLDTIRTREQRNSLMMLHKIAHSAELFPDLHKIIADSVNVQLPQLRPKTNSYFNLVSISNSPLLSAFELFNTLDHNLKLDLVLSLYTTTVNQLITNYR